MWAVAWNISAFMLNSFTYTITIAIPSKMQQDLTWPSLQNMFQIWGSWGLFQAIAPFYRGRELT